MKDIPMVTIWVSDFGNIQLPGDFPDAIMRLDGWWDERYKLVADGKAYIAEQSRKLETGEEKSGFHAPSFNDWRNAARS
jgi:hypothetical protein